MLSFKDDIEPMETEYNYKDVRLGDKGAVAVAEALNVASGLASVNLKSNGLRDTSARAIAALIQCHSNLESIDLSLNFIGDAGATALVEAIKSCPALQTLDLSGNPCHPKYRAMVQSFLSLSREDRLMAAGDPMGFQYIHGRGWRCKRDTRGDCNTAGTFVFEQTNVGRVDPSWAGGVSNRAGVLASGS